MLKLNPNQKRQPIGGHQFVEKGVTFTGDTFKEVVEKIYNFRTTNCLVLGDPEQDILVYYARNWPFMVMDDSVAIKTISPDRLFLWRQWIVEAWSKPPHKLVSGKEAAARWEICENCPFNKRLDWKETNETAELSRRAFLLRRGMTAPSFLGFCSLHNADLSVFTFIDNPEAFSKKKKDGEKVEGCWLK